MRSLILVALLALGGCVWGRRIKEVPVAVQPGGANVTLVLVGDTARRYGELFAVDSAGALVHTGRLTHYPWSRLESVLVIAISHNFDVHDAQRIQPAQRERLRLVSRFPHGIPEPVLGRVLQSLGQASVETLP